MDFVAQFKPTTTISINPPGGTGSPQHPHHPHATPIESFPTHVTRLLHATHTGHNALWIVFTLFTVGLLGVFILALRVEKRSRIFHWISASVLTIAMVSYLVMSTGMGILHVPIHNDDTKASAIHLIREVYIARYIDWLFTTPLLLLSLSVLAGISPAETVLVILADVFMIVTGLFGGLVNARPASGERARWAFFTISCVGFLAIWWILITGGVKAAKLRPSKTRGLFYLLAGMTLILWSAYPIVFGLTEGANILSVDVEIVSYAVLDVAAKLGFTFLLLIIHGDDDTWTLPEWFVEPRQGSGQDGRGGYGAINADE